MAEESPWIALKPDKALIARFAAIAEPGFVLIAGTVLAGIVLRRIGPQDSSHCLYSLATPDFRCAAFAQLEGLSTRFAIVIGLGVLLGLVRGRRKASSYGVTLGGHSLLHLLATGVLLAMVVSLPVQVLRLASAYQPLGPGTRFWALEARVPWNADFWLYMAVGSYLVVPIFEELYTRGYLLGRIRESFSAGGSLLAMAIFFSFSHAQYHHLDALAIGMEAGITLGALMLGYAVYRTGSLVPAIIAHGLGNVPMNTEARWVVLGASVAALLIWIKPVGKWIACAIRLLAEMDDWIPTLLCMAVFAAMMMTIGAAPWAVYAWLGAFGIATLPGLFRRSAWLVPR